MPRIKDITGQRFGKLVAIRESGRGTYNETMWECQCECGKRCIAKGTRMRRGATRSCGCYRRDIAKGRNILPPGVAALNQHWGRYQIGARVRQLSFSLSFEQFAAMVRADCAYCGQEPQPNRSGHPFNGVDRVENERGYEPDNCVPCCTLCNRAKGAMTHDRFKDWARRLAQVLGTS